MRTGKRLTRQWLSPRRWAQGLGARVKRHKQSQFGDILELRFGPSRSQAEARSTAWPSRHRLAARDARRDALARSRGTLLGAGRTRHEGRSRHGASSPNHLT